LIEQGKINALENLDDETVAPAGKRYNYENIFEWIKIEGNAAKK